MELLYFLKTAMQNTQTFLNYLGNWHIFSKQVPCSSFSLSPPSMLSYRIFFYLSCLAYVSHSHLSKLLLQKHNSSQLNTQWKEVIRHLQDLNCLKIIHDNRVTRRPVTSFNSFCFFILFLTLIAEICQGLVLKCIALLFPPSSCNVNVITIRILLPEKKKNY